VSPEVADESPNGLLLIDKPAGITSHDAVDRVRRSLRTKKVGHAGTLDPMATGLLLLGVGRATRLLRFLGELPKTYVGTMRLGEETTTLDAEGEITERRPVDSDDASLSAAMAALEGETQQIPPAYSAVKVGGRKLYEAARKGEELHADARTVRVDSFEMTARRGSDVDFKVVCGGGTYVRVLAADVGTALGCGAHLIALRRTHIGRFDVSDATDPSSPGPLLGVEDAVAHLPRLDLDPEEAIAAGHGRILGPAGISGNYGVFSPQGQLIGIYLDEPTKAVPQVILVG
jgi:tRNA pseudouridine55 synthase